MARKIFGYIITLVGIIGLIFFGNYKGTLISHTTFLMIGSIAIIYIGLFSTPLSKKNSKNSISDENLQVSNKLRINGEKIIIDINKCEFKENNYYEQIENSGYSKYKSIDASFDSNRNYEERYIEQSALVYHNTNDQKIEKFESQTFLFNAKILEGYVKSNSIVLFVDRFDRSIYFFELSK